MIQGVCVKRCDIEGALSWCSDQILNMQSLGGRGSSNPTPWGRGSHNLTPWGMGSHNLTPWGRGSHNPTPWRRGSHVAIVVGTNRKHGHQRELSLWYRIFERVLGTSHVYEVNIVCIGGTMWVHSCGWGYRSISKVKQ